MREEVIGERSWAERGVVRSLYLTSLHLPRQFQGSGSVHLCVPVFFSLKMTIVSPTWTELETAISLPAALRPT